MGINKACSICSRPNGAEIVNKLLDEKKLTLKQIGQTSGFSKSSVHRHSHKCYVRTRAEKLRATKFNPDTDRLVVLSPQTAPDLPLQLPPSYNPQTDWIVMPLFDPPHPSRSSRIISVADAFVQALFENSRRDAEKTSDSPSVEISNNGNNGNKPPD